MSKLQTLMQLLKNDRKGIAAALASNFSRSKISQIVPDKWYLKYMYRAYMGQKLDLKDPKTFNEKLQWLKLYDRNPAQIKLADKFEVKKYIAETIGEEYVIPTLGIYERFEDIDFEMLPNQFVLKCTHDSGSAVICKDKKNFDIAAAREKLTRKLKSKFFYYGREWCYKAIPGRILVEKYMGDGNNAFLIDYKFFCFNGEPKFLYVCREEAKGKKPTLNHITVDWEKLPFTRDDVVEFEELPPKPVNYDKMLEFSKKLSANFPFVRVDFYEIENQVYFGELTFYPGSGFVLYNPPEWDEKIGEWLELPPK